MTSETARPVHARPVAASFALGLLLISTCAAIAAETASAPPALSVSVKPARKMCFKEQVEVTGTFVPRQEVEVVATREGFKVSEILVSPLDDVTVGQALANLVPMEGPATAATTMALRSPVAGRVGQSAAVVGAPVSPRAGALFKIFAGGDLDLRADVAIRDLRIVSAGLPVQITPLGLPERPGRVQLASASIDPASQLGKVRIAVSASRDVRVGTFARGIITVGERCGVGAPYSSIMYESDGTIVQVVKNDRVEARQVSIGLLSDSYVEIKSGIVASDMIVSRAGPFLRDGDRVNPILVPDPPAAYRPEPGR